MNPFATAGDLALLWRPLSDTERPRAEILLSAASAMIRRLWPDVDSRIAAGEVSADEVLVVVADMVRRVMLTPNSGGIQSQTTQSGPFLETVRYSSTESGLYLTTAEKAVFGSSAQSARSVWVC